MSAIGPETSLSTIVEPHTSRTLAKIGVRTVRELLEHAPRRYMAADELTPLSDLAIGEVNHAVVRVVSSRRVDKEPKDRRPARSKVVPRHAVTITDGRGQAEVTIFGPKFLSKEWSPGSRIMVSGVVKKFGNHPRSFTNPEVRMADELEPDVMWAFYPGSSVVAPRIMWHAINSVLSRIDDWPDAIPSDITARHGLVDPATAYRLIHMPKSFQDVRLGRERLAWDEALVLQILLAQRRRLWQSVPAIPREADTDGIRSAFDQRLPFELTDGQLSAGEEIDSDLAQPFPMHRLLQGDVGSGKTLVALRAMLTVVNSGGQAALLAPTEVLATQHLRTLERHLGPLAQGGRFGGETCATRVALLTGSMGVPARREALADIACGDAGIVVGTHALLEEHVQFFDLGLVVIDEQHRFGVEQRAALALKGKDDKRPHMLVMTATPIPRTVAMTTFGALETSTIRELPVGRTPIATHVVPVHDRPAHFERVWERVREEVRAGRQVYVVCPKIGDDSDTEQSGASVLSMHEFLSLGPLRGLRVETMHGRMPTDAKDRVMAGFSAGETEVLVATTVIEVGVDVPNATVMVVMDADRFGISQLHQLRGRVGRGEHAGLCLLVTETAADSTGAERLKAVAATTDGFELARLDTELRRAGDVLGANQSGRSTSLKFLDVLVDEDVIASARGEAQALVDQDPGLSGMPALGELVEQFEARLDVEYLEKL